MRYALLLFALLACTSCADKALVDDSPGTVPPRVEIEAPVTALMAGATTRLSATYYDGEGRAVPQTAFSWTSSDPSVATINSDATVTAIAPGGSSIHASANGVESEGLAFIVVADASQAANVTVMPSSVELQPGETHLFAAVVTNIEGAPLPDVPVTWSTSRSDVATVNREGLVLGRALGSASIIATAEGVTSAPAIVDVPPGSRDGAFTPTTGHEAVGEAIVVRQDDGSLILTFSSDFSVTDGPGLYVYLSNLRGVNSSSLQIAPLTSAAGTQSYRIEGASITQFDYAVVHCVPFMATFAWAQLN